MEKPSGKKKTLPGKTASLVTRGKQNKLSATQLLTLFTGTRWGKVCMGTAGRSNRQQCSCILAVTDHLYISLNAQVTSMQFYSTHNVRCGLMNKLAWRNGTEPQEGSGSQIWYEDTAAQQLSVVPPLTLGKRYSPFTALQQQRGMRMRLQGSTLVQNR